MKHKKAGIAVLIAASCLIIAGAIAFTVWQLSKGPTNEELRNQGAVAAVNGEGIYPQDIEQRLTFNRMTNTINYNVISGAFSGEELQEQIDEIKRPSGEDSVLEELIEGVVIRDTLTRQGICYSYEMTQKAADLDYQLAKTERTDGAYERYISEELKQNNMTEEEYLSLLYDYSYDNYNYYRLKSIFAEDLYNEASQKSLDEQFDQYVEHLVETADVEIFTTQSNV